MLTSISFGLVKKKKMACVEKKNHFGCIVFLKQNNTFMKVCLYLLFVHQSHHLKKKKHLKKNNKLNDIEM